MQGLFSLSARQGIFGKRVVFVVEPLEAILLPLSPLALLRSTTCFFLKESSVSEKLLTKKLRLERNLNFLFVRKVSSVSEKLLARKFQTARGLS